MTDFDILFRLFLGLALGGAIGFERRWRGHEAGPHTNALVAMGSAFFIIVGLQLGGDASARVLAQVATGIGFLAGGVILREGFRVRGLNTAATIWCVAALGCFIGFGHLTLAIEVTALFVVANSFFHILEHNFKRLNDIDEEDTK